jgi:hypothetical protein
MLQALGMLLWPWLQVCLAQILLRGRLRGRQGLQCIAVLPKPAAAHQCRQVLLLLLQLLRQKWCRPAARQQAPQHNSLHQLPLLLPACCCCCC